jgi:hypothetical protein
MGILSVIGKLISGIFGIAVFAAGIINTFWGNDPFFGIFLIFVSIFYFLKVDTLITLTKKITTLSIGPALAIVVKVLVGIFVFVATLGVGELFDKIDMMVAYYNSLGF